MRPPRRQLQPLVRSWSAGKPVATLILIFAHFGAFGAQIVLDLVGQDRFLAADWLQKFLALDGNGIAVHEYWRFFTCALLHDGPWPWHLVANMTVLYFAGREVEPIIGWRHFLGLYAAGNFLGAVAQWYFMPEFLFVGVSAGVAAVLAGYATILPELEGVVHLFFIVPLRMKAKHLGLGLALVSAVLWYTLAVPQIGPAGMLAGCVVGWLYVKCLGFGNPFWFQRLIFDKRRREARLTSMPAEQFISEKIDPILDKIAEHGMQSLTRAERKVLEQGRNKIEAKTARRV